MILFIAALELVISASLLSTLLLQHQAPITMAALVLIAAGAGRLMCHVTWGPPRRDSERLFLLDRVILHIGGGFIFTNALYVIALKESARAVLTAVLFLGFTVLVLQVAHILGILWIDEDGAVELRRSHGARFAWSPEDREWVGHGEGGIVVGALTRRGAHAAFHKATLASR